MTDIVRQHCRAVRVELCTAIACVTADGNAFFVHEQPRQSAAGCGAAVVAGSEDAMHSTGFDVLRVKRVAVVGDRRKLPLQWKSDAQ